MAAILRASVSRTRSARSGAFSRPPGLKQTAVQKFERLQRAIDRALLPHCVVTHFVARQHISSENVQAPALRP